MPVFMQQMSSLVTYRVCSFIFDENILTGKFSVLYELFERSISLSMVRVDRRPSASDSNELGLRVNTCKEVKQINELFDNS